jgi:hypothetical protein
MGPVSFQSPVWQRIIVWRADKRQFDEGFYVGNYMSKSQYG